MLENISRRLSRSDESEGQAANDSGTSYAPPFDQPGTWMKTRVSSTVSARSSYGPWLPSPEYRISASLPPPRTWPWPAHLSE